MAKPSLSYQERERRALLAFRTRVATNPAEDPSHRQSAREALSVPSVDEMRASVKKLPTDALKLLGAIVRGEAADLSKYGPAASAPIQPAKTAPIDELATDGSPVASAIGGISSPDEFIPEKNPAKEPDPAPYFSQLEHDWREEKKREAEAKERHEKECMDFVHNRSRPRY